VKIAYLILAHNNPKHLLRLIRALSSSSSSFFIHIDRKSSLDDFANINGDNVYVSQERIPVYWGDFSQVEAILALLRIALTDPRRFDYFVLLSGTDYPLQSVSYIESFFERNKGKEFMNIVPMPCEAVGKPITRLTTYKPRPGDPTSKIAKFVRKLLVKIGAFQTERDYKSHLRNLVPYAGSTWWALSRGACEYILSFVASEPRIVNFFKHTVCPDESFFQTILGNSPYKARIRRNLTYTDWSSGGSSPAYITEQHLGFFTSSSPIIMDDAYGVGEVLFARKFSDQAEDIVAQIDQLIREREDRLTKRCT
jgi:hypothetical protein